MTQKGPNIRANCVLGWFRGKNAESTGMPERDEWLRRFAQLMVVVFISFVVAFGVILGADLIEWALRMIRRLA
jgi:hypothetical protein